ncbi:MAG: AAA family ATPase [Thermoleophilaceae bacterium]|nr:AAA family ATPase [Thermoleophilaceae bacterium]
MGEQNRLSFRILGPLEVRLGGARVEIGGPRQRGLLALLLLNANRVVPGDRLIDELWGGADRPDALKALHVAVSRLRTAIDPTRRGEEILVTRTPGYVLRLEPGQLDLDEFDALVAKGRDLIASGTPSEASRTLAEALALWRGEPLADLTYEPFVQAEAEQLTERRLIALELRTEADLALGRHADLVPELERLAREQPLRDRVTRQLMLALYRSGRQADALQVYRSRRSALVAELGLEPSNDLRQLEQAVLIQDPSLDWSRPGGLSTSGSGPSSEGRPGRRLVGRASELAALTSGFEAAVAGRGSLFLVGGEPGIGKSRLAEELVARVPSQGGLVLVGRCWEAGGAPAYWPWVQALRSYLHGADPEVLRVQLGERASDLAQLLPELREVIPNLPAAGAGDADGARFRLFDAVAELLRGIASVQPVLLVLEDLHGADEPSLLLLQFVARDIARSRLLVVATYRDLDPSLAEPLAGSLGELAREAVTHKIDLAGLAATEVGEFIELVSPTAPAADWARTIHAETAGNPLFVAEMVRLLAAEHRLERPPTGPIAIPQTVRDVIGRRLRSLSQECRALLEVASVLGREFDLDALGAVSGTGRDQMLVLLDEALEVRVVAEVPGAPGRMRFGHALIRDAAYHGLPRRRRIQLHREVGQALEELHAGDLDPRLAEIAHHFGAAVAGGDSQKAVEYATRAAERAALLLAFEEAVRLYEAALEALAAGTQPDSRARLELLLSLGDAQGRAGSLQAAKGTFLTAARQASASGAPEALARAAVGYGGRFLWQRSVSDSQLVPLVEEALRAIGEEDSILRVQLLSRLAAALRDEASRAQREPICEEAIACARRLEDPAALAYALAAAEAALFSPHTVHRRYAEGKEILVLAEQIGDGERLFDGHEHLYWCAWELGDRPERDRQLAAMERAADQLRQPSQLWLLGLARGVLALDEGRLDEAESLVESAVTVGEATQGWNARVAHFFQKFMLRRLQGRLDQFETETRTPGEAVSEPLAYGAVTAYLHAAAGRSRQAANSLDELLAHGLADWHVDEEWLFSVALLAETCATVGHDQAAGPLYDLLLPHEQLNAIAVGEASLGSVGRPLGLLAEHRGDLDVATGHYETALDMNGRMGSTTWLVETQNAYARTLSRRAGRGR